MAHHPFRARLVTVARPVALLGSLLLFATIALAVAPAHAHNTWTGGYRKWPWKASTDETLGTLPGQCPHCPGSESSSAWKAIDVPSMDYETVYSISPGTVDGYDAVGSSAAGKYLRIKDADGSYVTYEHLDSLIVTTGTVVAGQPIAVSGNTGNSSGAHLHFQRHDGPSFWSNALDLVPISGHGASDALSRTAYTSDNAGIGYSSGDYGARPIRDAYAAHGGYRHVGVSADIGDAWSPCRNDTIAGTWWRYRCSSNGYGGNVQTYVHQGKQRALMLADGTSTAYLLTRGILGAFTDRYAGSDYVHWLGYPTSNAVPTYEGSTTVRQSFQSGAIYMKGCTQWVYLSGSLVGTYGYCD